MREVHVTGRLFDLLAELSDKTDYGLIIRNEAERLVITLSDGEALGLFALALSPTIYEPSVES